MKRDIRDLFKEEGELKTLPRNHRFEFLEKLNKQPNKQSGTYGWLKIAAVLLVALTIGFSLFYTKPVTDNVSPIIAQIEAVEAEYLQNIEAEWKSFVAITEDSILVKRYKNKLDDLDNDYQEVSAQFNEESNNILIVEELINNLQKRLKLLKDIQSQIKLINQENEQNENTI